MERLDWTSVFNTEKTSSGGLITEEPIKECTCGKVESEKEKPVIKSKVTPLKVLTTAGVILVSGALAMEVLNLLPFDTAQAVSQTVADSTSWTPEAEEGLKAIEATAQVAQEGVPEATGDGWELLIDKVLTIVDYLMDGVIIFAGISWIFGNRTKAIELLFGAGVGYVIVRHHDDIRNFFALL